MHKYRKRYQNTEKCGIGKKQKQQVTEPTASLSILADYRLAAGVVDIIGENGYKRFLSFLSFRSFLSSIIPVLLPGSGRELCSRKADWTDMI